MSTSTTPPAIRSLYRSLLRASSYLPTAETRQWTTTHIIDRFHRKDEPDPKTLRKARQGLYQLERAIEGDISALTKVFMHTYGRSGPRRRILLDQTTSILSATDKSLPAIHPPQFPPPKPRPGKLGPNSGGTLEVPLRQPAAALTHFQRLLKDQSANRPSEVLGRNMIKFLDPPVPERNIWNKPVPRKRERGIVRKWVRDSLQNILPPLPSKEWDVLRLRGTGEVGCESPPERRVKVGSWDEGESMLTVDNIKNSIRNSQLPLLRSRLDTRNRHAITPKFLQRLHASIWQLSCKMHWDAEKQTWRYTWGKGKNLLAQGKKREIKGRDLQLFEGLDQVGSVGESRSKRAFKKDRKRMMGRRAEKVVGEVPVEGEK